jgi:DNA-binding NarL/FixJ family response regulator
MKVVIIDDHPIVADGLKNLLESSNIQVTGIYHLGETAWSDLDRTVPDAILMDINLPDVSGVVLCQRVRQKYPAVRVIALSVHNERPVIMGMLNSGASGYVLKNATGADIISALKAAGDGLNYLCSGTQQVLGSYEGNGSKEVPRLTRREKEILQLLGTGQTTQQIAARLFISTHTVESHRKNLIEKFGVPNTATVIKLATDLGLF